MVFDRCVRDFGECNCDCHNNIAGVIVHHMMPCCSECHICGKRLKFSYNDHVEKCQKEYVENLEKLMNRSLTDEEKNELGIKE